jgi:hypothetical protein
MKNTFATLLTVSAFAFPSFSFASNTCVPSMSVDQAKAQLDAGISQISQELQARYAAAGAAFDQANETCKTKHEARMKAIETQYQEEVRTIKENLSSGWREQLAAATNARNESVAQSTQLYTTETEAHLATYNQICADAQADFNAKASALNAQYNQAVCAAH